MNIVVRANELVTKPCVFYGCPQGHGLHLEIDPYIDTMTRGPGTLVVYSLINILVTPLRYLTHTRSTVHSLSASATAVGLDRLHQKKVEIQSTPS